MSEPELNELELPGLCKAADEASASSQRSFFWFKRAELSLLVVGAASGLVPTAFLGGAGAIVAIVAFMVVVVVQLVGVVTKAESRWYDARAAAESIKSAAWQFAVGGEAFRIDSPDVDKQFKNRLKAMLTMVPKLDLPPAKVSDASITASMSRVRAMPLNRRVEIYCALRVEDQVSWYAAKALWNRRRRKLFTILTLSVELLAVVFGIIRLTSGLDLDLLGVFAAAGAGLIAWTQAKKYEFLAESYAVTSHEARMVRETLAAPESETVWAQVVHDAEAAFSREHTMWQARRQSPSH